MALSPVVLTDHLLTRRVNAIVTVHDTSTPSSALGIARRHQYYQIDTMIQSQRVRFYVVVNLYDEHDEAVMDPRNLETRAVIMDEDLVCPAMVIIYYHATVACVPCLVSNGPIPIDRTQDPGKAELC